MASSPRTRVADVFLCTLALVTVALCTVPSGGPTDLPQRSQARQGGVALSTLQGEGVSLIGRCPRGANLHLRAWRMGPSFRRLGAVLVRSSGVGFRNVHARWEFEGEVLELLAEEAVLGGEEGGLMFEECALTLFGAPPLRAEGVHWRSPGGLIAKRVSQWDGEGGPRRLLIGLPPIEATAGGE
jgi:hypothetical protein